MGTPSPAVTNRAADQSAGMTLRELIRFVSDCLQAPIPVDQDQPLRVQSTIAGRVRQLSAPLEPCTCPWRQVGPKAVHHPACAHRVAAA